MDLAVAQPRISRAVRRCRRARAARARRRQWLAALGACVSIGLAGVTALAVGAATGEDVVQAAVSRAQDLADLLDGRSPGERTQAQLNKTRHARAAAARPRLALRPPASHDRSVATPLVPPNPDLATLLAALPVVAPVEFGPPVEIAPGPPPSIGSLVGSSPGTPGSTPGGSGPLTFPSSETRLPVDSAVPEPSTWAMMLMGFGLIGWRVRRGGKSRVARLSA